MEEVQEIFLDFHHNGVFGLVVKDVNTSEQVVYVYKSLAKDFTSEVHYNVQSCVHTSYHVFAGMILMLWPHLLAPSNTLNFFGNEGGEHKTL